MRHYDWVVCAYDQFFVGRTAELAMRQADAYGELHQLRAVSLIAHPVKRKGRLNETIYHARLYATGWVA